MGIRDHFLHRIDDSGKRDSKTEDPFHGNLRSQKKIVNFLTDFREISGTSRKSKLYSFIFYNISGQIQKKDAQMIPGDIQSDGKTVIRSGTQCSGSAAAGWTASLRDPAAAPIRAVLWWCWSRWGDSGADRRRYPGWIPFHGYRDNGRSDSGFSFSLLYLSVADAP